VRPVQLQRLAPRGHKLNGPRRQKAPSRPIHLMLVGAGQAASAFLFVQLRRLEARGHKSRKPKRQRTPSWPIRLMPHASEQSPSAFLFVQLWGLEAPVISQLVQEGKKQTPSWPIRLMPPASDQSPSAFLTRRRSRGGSPTARGKRSFARESLAMFRVHYKMFAFGPRQKNHSRRNVFFFGQNGQMHKQWPGT
jgi:hypothetical protein